VGDTETDHSCGVQSFFSVVKAARNGPLTPPPGRVAGPPLALWPDHANARRLACRPDNHGQPKNDTGTST
jgi:hypothetical protein